MKSSIAVTVVNDGVNNGVIEVDEVVVDVNVDKEEVDVAIVDNFAFTSQLHIIKML